MFNLLRHIYMPQYTFFRSRTQGSLQSATLAESSNLDNPFSISRIFIAADCKHVSNAVEKCQDRKTYFSRVVREH